MGKKQRKKYTIISIIAIIIVVFFASLFVSYAFFVDQKTNSTHSNVATMALLLDPANTIQDIYDGKDKAYSISIKNQGNISAIIRVQVVLEWNECLESIENITLSQNMLYSTDQYYYIDHYVSPQENNNIAIAVSFENNPSYIGKEYSIQIYSEAIQKQSLAYKDSFVLPSNFDNK